MKKQLVVVLLMLGTVCVARAQVVVPDPKGTDRNVAANFSAAPAASATVLGACDNFKMSAGVPCAEARASAPGLGNAAPDATPVPDPRFVYGGRNDFRWQLGIGVDWLRFRSSIFNASAVGVDG